MKLLSVKQAAVRLGVHPDTIRAWSSDGRLPFERIGARGDRRFDVADLDALLSARPSGRAGVTRVAVYARVSGRGGGDRLTSLMTQERELREALPTGSQVVKVYKDVGSGLSEKREALSRALRAARKGEYDELHVTHTDRLARFGTRTLTELFESYGVTVRVLHEADNTPEEELMSDFMTLLALFSGRLYGQRSASAKRRLLERAKHTGRTGGSEPESEEADGEEADGADEPEPEEAGATV